MSDSGVLKKSRSPLTPSRMRVPARKVLEGDQCSFALRPGVETENFLRAVLIREKTGSTWISWQLIASHSSKKNLITSEYGSEELLEVYRMEEL